VSITFTHLLEYQLRQPEEPFFYIVVVEMTILRMRNIKWMMGVVDYDDAGEGQMPV
jgi:hypothetical protein